MADTPNSLRKTIEELQVVEVSPPEISPVSAQVSININPVAIPFGILSYVDIEKLVYSSFYASFDPSSVDIPGETSQIPTSHIIRHLIQTGKIISFSGGYAPYAEGDLVVIEKLGFGQQTIFAKVRGTTKQAEYICKKLAEVLWEAVDRPIRWNELSKHVHIVSYETSARVDMGRSVKNLFSKGFLSFLNNKLGGESGFGHVMGNLGQYKTPDDRTFSIVTSVKALQIEISIFDPVSGKQEECTIEVIPDTTFDHNGRYYKVQSELPYDKHVEMLSELIVANMPENE